MKADCNVKKASTWCNMLLNTSLKAVTSGPNTPTTAIIQASQTFGKLIVCDYSQLRYQVLLNKNECVKSVIFQFEIQYGKQP